MRKTQLCFAIILCLLLTGCSWMDGDYISVTPHQRPSSGNVGNIIIASNYRELREALENMVSRGSESAVINVAGFDQDEVASNMQKAVKRVHSEFPIAAYAVEEIEYELGASGGVPAVAVKIHYLHGSNEIRKIRKAADMEAAKVLIGVALEQYDPGVVILVGEYIPTDVAQIAEDYALRNPSAVMETPQVTAEVYPNTGEQRVLELKFTYQTSRDDLRQMRTQAKPVFDAAALYVSGDDVDMRKYSQLYAFLMERFTDYQVKTSITPAYSLLRHGVGDSKTFAAVYAEMCRRAGMECQIVIGTRDGEPWCWNMVQIDGFYYHVDLLKSWGEGGFRKQTDSQMTDYVWDYSSYPTCIGAPPVTDSEETEPPTDPSGGDNTPEETVDPVDPASYE